MLSAFLRKRRSRSFCAVVIFGSAIFLLMAMRVLRKDDIITADLYETLSKAISEMRPTTRPPPVIRPPPNNGGLSPASPSKPLRQYPVPRGGVWAEACPNWSPPTSPTPAPALSPELQAEAAHLTQILQARLDLPNDIEMPDFSESCEVLKQDKDKYLKACTTPSCGQKINPSLEERVKDVLGSPELQLSEEERLAIDELGKQIPVNDIVIVSAASSDHFGEAQKMFKSLHEVVYPKLKNFTAVLVDIGLTANERKMAENSCRCTVVRFPYEVFPPHVKINQCYSFKPLSVLAAIQRARRLVVWQDSSVRWEGPGLQYIMDRTLRYGTQIVRYEGSARVTAHTLRPPFDYMKREVCAFTPFPEIEACAQVHMNDPVTLRLILEPWAKCALERCCICPAYPPPVLPCVDQVAEHRCQRFDQSAMTMVLARLLNDKFQKIVMPNWYANVSVLHKLGGDVMNNYFKL